MIWVNINDAMHCNNFSHAMMLPSLDRGDNPFILWSMGQVTHALQDHYVSGTTWTCQTIAEC